MCPRSHMSYNVRIMRSLRNVVEQIWENAEPRHFPHNPCYTRVRSDSDESAASPSVTKWSAAYDAGGILHSYEIFR